MSFSFHKVTLKKRFPLAISRGSATIRKIFLFAMKKTVMLAGEKEHQEKPKELQQLMKFKQS